MSTRSKARLKSHVVSLNDYDIIREINRGGFGVVYLIERKDDHQKFAAKVNIQKLTPEQDKFISREIGILIRVQSPTIIRFYGFSLQDFQGN